MYYEVISLRMAISDVRKVAVPMLVSRPPQHKHVAQLHGIVEVLRPYRLLQYASSRILDEK